MNTMKKLAALNAKADALRASLKKDLDAAEKKVATAKAKAEAAVKEFRQASDALTSIREAMGLKTAVPTDEASLAPVKAAKATAPAGVRLKKDGTPAKKPGPKGGKPGPKPAKAAKVAKAAKPAKAEGGVRLKKDGTPAKKPGPKKDGEAKPAPAPKANGAAHLKADGTPKKKPGPKPKAEKAEAAPEKKAAKGGKPSRAAEGRRAVLTGERPTLKNAIKQVMGSKTMNTQEVYDALKEKNWLPNSSDPKGYVGYTLSSDKKVFERVADKGRGHYRVRPESSAATSKADTAPETEKVEPKKAESKKVEKDPVLADAEDILGMN